MFLKAAGRNGARGGLDSYTRTGRAGSTPKANNLPRLARGGSFVRVFGRKSDGRDAGVNKRESF
jgi:hypothetical protein